MRPREQLFTGPRQQDHQAPINPFDSFIHAVLHGDPTHDLWQVLLHDQFSGEDHLCQYFAASGDDAESMAHHDAIEVDPHGSYTVLALDRLPRRGLWDVRLQEHARVIEQLPTGIPLLVGRVSAAHAQEARAQALARFGRAQRADGVANAWRYVSQGDLFTVVRC